MSHSSFNYNPGNLTPEQERLITMYINQYNQTNTHIDILLDMLDEIRGNIINVINTTQTRRTQINRQTNTNISINRLLNRLFNDRQNNYVYYDYNNPINPSIYNEHNTINLRNRRNEYVDMSYNNLHRTNNSIPTPNNYLSTIISNFLNSTVVIRPTLEQIQNASRIIRYGDIANPLSDSCPISLDEFNDDDQVRQLLPCGHLFHQNQFQQWFANNVRCPVCRYDIRNYMPLSRRNSPNHQSEQTTEPQTTEPQTSSPVSTLTDTHVQNTTSETNTNIDNNSTQPLSNMNVVIDQIATNMFQSMLNPLNQNMNDRFMFDPSNNILFFETIIRPNSNQNEDNNDDNN